jgi:adenine phosphoribosyltransferase
MQSVLLASKGLIKSECVKSFFPSDKFNITYINCDKFGCKLPSQPINCTEQCAKFRLNYAKKITYPIIYDYYISIENGIEHDEEDEDDIPLYVCVVFIENKGLLGYSDTDTGFSVPLDYFKKLSGFTHDLSTNIQGYNTTIGNLMEQDDPSINKRNWILSYHGVCRSAQIKDQIQAAMLNLSKAQTTAKSLLSNMKYYSRFPINSTELKTCGELKTFGELKTCSELKYPDVFSLIRDYENIQQLYYLIADQYRFDSIDYVIGLQSKGFLGLGLSCTLGLGFIPICKGGKLSGDTISFTYKVGLEEETICIPDDIPLRSRVIIFDDLISSGTSLKAAYDLVRLTGCVIVDCITIAEIVSFKEDAHNKMGCHYKVLLQE